MRLPLDAAHGIAEVVSVVQAAYVEKEGRSMNEAEKTGYTIGKPAPIPTRSKYEDLRRQVLQLQDDEALPVDFLDLRRAGTIVSNTQTWQRWGIKLQQRGTVIWFSKITEPSP